MVFNCDDVQRTLELLTVIRMNLCDYKSFFDLINFDDLIHFEFILQYKQMIITV